MDNKFRLTVLETTAGMGLGDVREFGHDSKSYSIKYIAPVTERDGSEIRMYWLYGSDNVPLYQLHIDSSNEISMALNLRKDPQNGGGRRRKTHRRKTNRRRRTHK
jgi:hypothetical protein